MHLPALKPEPQKVQYLRGLQEEGANMGPLEIMLIFGGLALVAFVGFLVVQHFALKNNISNCEVLRLAVSTTPSCCLRSTTSEKVQSNNKGGKAPKRFAESDISSAFSRSTLGTSSMSSAIVSQSHRSSLNAAPLVLPETTKNTEQPRAKQKKAHDGSRRHHGRKKKVPRTQNRTTVKGCNCEEPSNDLSQLTWVQAKRMCANIGLKGVAATGSREALIGRIVTSKKSHLYCANCQLRILTADLL